MYYLMLLIDLSKAIVSMHENAIEIYKVIGSLKWNKIESQDINDTVFYFWENNLFSVCPRKRQTSTLSK